MRKQPRILITGGAGFIGSHFTHLAVSKDHPVCVVDKLTYAGNLDRLKSIRLKISFYKTDIYNKKELTEILNKEKPSIIVHFAGETHVDRSLENIQPFIHSNIGGTQSLIEAAHHCSIKKFIHISTDEVYGQGKKASRFKETSPVNPTNPYAVTKATAELLVAEHISNKKFPAVIVRPCNTYGPFQFPEKFIPVVISKALKNNPIPIYGKGRQIREWIYVDDCVKAVYQILTHGKTGEVYNIGSRCDFPNITVAQMILKILKKPQSLIKFVQDREGHDFCYLVDNRKILKLGWKPETGLEEGIRKIVTGT